MPLQKISLKEAGKITGYAPDYLGFLIRRGLIKGKKIPKNPPWLVPTADLLKYAHAYRQAGKKTKNLATRDSSFLLLSGARKSQEVFQSEKAKKQGFRNTEFLLWKNYLTLKQAAEVTGYASDHIGFLIRKGKLPGKRFYKLNSWQTDTENINEYLAQKKLKIFLISSLLGGIKNIFNPFLLKISKYGMAVAVFFFIIFGGMAGWAFTVKNQPQIAEIYPADMVGDLAGWQNSQNALGLADVRSDGNIDLFSESNSAVYKGGTSNLIAQNFYQTETSLNNEKINAADQNQNNLTNSSEGTTTAPEETAGETIIENTQSETAATTEEQIIDNQVSPETTPEITPEIIPENSIPENGTEPVSLLDKITPIKNIIFNGARKIFSKGTAVAQEVPTFDELAQNEFQGAKIKFSFAIGEKTPDVLIEQKNIQEPQNNTTTGGESGFFEKIKNFFKF